MRGRALNGQPGAIRTASDSGAREIAQAQCLSIRGGELHQENRRDPVAGTAEFSLEVFGIEFGNGIGVHVVEAAVVGEEDGAAVSRGSARAFLFALPKMK